MARNALAWRLANRPGPALAWLLGALVMGTACGGRSSDPRPLPQGAAGEESESSIAGAPSSGGGPLDTGGVPSADAGATGCAPPAAPLRRLSRFEYNNTVRELLFDSTEPGNALSVEPTPTYFGFDNDVASQTPTAEGVATYLSIAKAVARRATSAGTFAAWLPCAAGVTDGTAAACARTFVESFAPLAFRRALDSAELTELAELHASVMNSGGSFSDATAAVLAAVLAAPDFLYRVELGVPDPDGGARRRLRGEEMAARLSYLFWGAPPDAALRDAALGGELDSAAGVHAQSKRLLADSRSHAVVATFFDQLLELDQLGQLRREESVYTPAFGQQLRAATQRFFEYEIFEKGAAWPAIWTAPEAFANAQLGPLYYGVSDLIGAPLQKVMLDPAQRLGFLTDPGVLIGFNPDGQQNPDQRGALVVNRLLCRGIPSHPVPHMSLNLPGATARERWASVASAAPCAACHREMDAVGLALERYDSLGRYRTQESGQPIDTQIELPSLGVVDGAVELSRTLSTLPEIQTCFVQRWLEFSAGRQLDTTAEDQCLSRSVNAAFAASGYDVPSLLLALTQTDAFLFLPKE